MSSYAAIYATLDQGEFAKWMEDFWFGEVGTDALRRLRDPIDCRGEVTAWGRRPHYTVLDAMIISSPDAFREIAQRICEQSPPPVLQPECLIILGNALAVKCTSPELAEIRSALIAATSHLIERTRLADEEWQRSQWWVDRVSGSPQARRDLLDEARRLYAEVGCPPLPTSRHFRLGFLVSLLKKVNEATEGAKKEKATAAVKFFLEHGQPPSYRSGGKFHTTIASGLRITDRKDRERQEKEFNELLWPSVMAKLGEHNKFGDHKLDSLAIMVEDLAENVEVHFFDHLTDTYVKEQRPCFKADHELRFAP